MLIVKNLSKSFGTVKALDKINFSVKKGEVVTLLGPNGAGKTTLLRLITGYYRPDTGEVFIGTDNVSKNRIQALSKISYVPESGALYQEMTVYEYLKYMAALRKMKHQSFVDNMVSLTKGFGLEKIINKKIETLSKGYKKRVGIAGALLNRPEILVLDEPTEGLDPNQKFSVREFIKNYGKNNIVIISTHIMEEVCAMANRVIMLNKGRLVKDTRPEELRLFASDNNIETAFRKLTLGEDL